jgi:hypothetical protein
MTATLLLVVLVSMPGQVATAHSKPPHLRLVLSEDDHFYCRGDASLETLAISLAGVLSNVSREILAICVPCLGQASVSPFQGTSRAPDNAMSEQHAGISFAEPRAVSLDEWVVLRPGESVKLSIPGTVVINTEPRSLPGVLKSGIATLVFEFGIGNWSTDSLALAQKHLGPAVVFFEGSVVAPIRVNISGDRDIADCDSERTTRRWLAKVPKGLPLAN